MGKLRLGTLGWLEWVSWGRVTPRRHLYPDPDANRLISGQMRVSTRLAFGATSLPQWRNLAEVRMLRALPRRLPLLLAGVVLCLSVNGQDQPSLGDAARQAKAAKSAQIEKSRESYHQR